MAYDKHLAERVRQLLKRRKSISERKMFGGVCFMLSGNMCCGVMATDLMLRLGADGAAAALEAPHTRLMDLTGRPMKSIICVEPEGYEHEDDLETWVASSVKFAVSLPSK